MSLQIKLTDTLKGEKQTHFYSFLRAHGSTHKRMKTQKSEQSRKFLYVLNKKIKKKTNLWRIDETKGFGWGVVSCGEVTRKVRDCLTRFVCTDFFWLDCSSLVIECLPFSGFREDIFYMEFYLLLSGIKRRASVSFLAPAASQVSLTQNNPYAKVACSELLPKSEWKWIVVSFNFFVVVVIVAVAVFSYHSWIPKGSKSKQWTLPEVFSSTGWLGYTDKFMDLRMWTRLGWWRSSSPPHPPYSVLPDPFASQVPSVLNCERKVFVHFVRST